LLDGPAIFRTGGGGGEDDLVWGPTIAPSQIEDEQVSENNEQLPTPPADWELRLQEEVSSWAPVVVDADGQEWEQEF